MSNQSKFAIQIRKQHTSLTFEIGKAPFYINVGSWIIVETNRGEEMGQVVKLPLSCRKLGLHESVKVRQILRVATPEDEVQYDSIPELEKDIFLQANQLFEKTAIDLKLISAELVFNKKKVIFYYRRLEDDQQQQKQQKGKQPQQQPQKREEPKTNVRDLNRDLYALTNIPVELREMGNRASAYVVGGVGHCGCGLCCTTWLHKPMQVSVKMAKEQSLAINIPKLSGVCGKLMCCIAYEGSQYERGVLQDGPRANAQNKEFNALFDKK